MNRATIKETSKMMLFLGTGYRKGCGAVSIISLIAFLAAIAATPAFAAPEFGVMLERDETVVSHSDERLDYTVKVTNALSGASASAGDTLTCYTGTWSNPVQFIYRWLRNGEVISGATANTYTTTSPADEGKVIECQVGAINTTPDNSDPTDFAGRTHVTSGVVVNPQPAIAPPTPPGFIPPPAQSGLLDGTATQELTCEAGSWEGIPTSYTYRWYRNGQEIAGTMVTTAATSTKLTLLAADQSPPAEFQCSVTGLNAGGARTKASAGFSVTSPAPDPSDPIPGNPPFIATADFTKGPVTVEVELPAGDETYAYKAFGEEWSCDKVPSFEGQHAKAICTNPQVIAPGGSFKPLTVVARLDPNAPDLAVAKATAFGAGAVEPKSAVNEFTFAPFREFGLEPGTFKAALLDCEGNEYTQAGGHPCFGAAEVKLAKRRTIEGFYVPIEHVRQLTVDLPRGQVANPLSVPELCPTASYVVSAPGCPAASVVGSMNIVVRDGEAGVLPIYAIKPEFGIPAAFAFTDSQNNVYTLSGHLRPDDGYAISVDLAPPPKVDFLSSTARFCNFGAELSGGLFKACKKAGEPGSNPVPLFTNPTRCGEPAPVVRMRMRSWEHPAIEKESSFTVAQITGCDKVKFEPAIGLHPTSHQADSPTGLDVDLSMSTDDLESQTGISQANLKRARVTFPEGMSVNPSAGQGLGACSADQVKLKTNLPIECPDSSKIGSVEIDTPLLQETMTGAVYIAKQGDVDGALIGFYLVFDSKRDGVLVKIPARVDPKPNGQLVVTVDESPEQPFSAVRMHFPGGPRATLLNPPTCGTKAIETELTPWTGGAPVTKTLTYDVTSGPNGGPCPNGGFAPKFSAGTENPTAGKKSPFVLRLTRDDGMQRFVSLSMDAAPGLTAYLASIPYCPQGAIDAARARTEGQGVLELTGPSCPASSLIGTASAGAGAGSDLLFVKTGRAYLAGPYKGAPLSLVLVTPVVAGPLDLGNVVVQVALRVDPETLEITAVSDTIPTILRGILTNLRDIRVAIDRPNFIVNPTNCEQMAIHADVRGDAGGRASLTNRFQVGGCDKLSFKPKLSVRLLGGTHRGAHPRMRSTIEAAPGEANIGRAAVTIPRSEFLDQGHIRTICTRVQFAADACPKGSIYGHATATSPLVGYSVQGPVYLRSSSHKLPDLVIALHGPDYQPVEVIAVGRIDSIKGQIRATFEHTPDVPIDRFTLSLQGGKKGLLVNSRDICASDNRATVKLGGQNGKTYDTRPVVKNSKCKAQHKKRRR